MPVPLFRPRPPAHLALLAVLALAGPLAAQDFWMGERTFSCYRTVTLPPGPAAPAVVVTEFYAHGELRPDGGNLVVVDGRSRPVPRRLLQIGPGDFCRVAFQTARGERTYRVYYGGPVPEEKPPAWTANAGLVLQTYRWRDCDLSRVESVRAALEAASSVAAGYVPSVFHRGDPFGTAPGPFLSRYRGTLRVAVRGTYRFFTSSQDCSFLLIDGKVVVAAPGRRGPVGDARIAGSVSLDAGEHAFEYLHAAAGGAACMVAAWHPPGASAPEIIPAKAFDGDAVVPLPASGPRNRLRGPLPDFAAEVAGEVGLADSDVPLVRVAFKDTSAGGFARHAPAQWDFGDGQSSDLSEPVHVYLRPGLYTVKLTVRQGMLPLEVVQRIHVGRAVPPAPGKNGPDRLADYRPILAKYDATRLDPPALVQFVRALEQDGQLDRAATVAKSALPGGRLDGDANAALALAGLAGPWLRDRLDDAAGAAAVWQGAARAARSSAREAACLAEAADVLLNDLLRRDATGPLLDRAERQAVSGATAAKLHRVRGDWHARGGDRAAARTAYARAQAAAGPLTGTAEEVALRGAFSRSAEAFLRDKQFDRALDELRRWQDRFPADKIDGYLPLLFAHYWEARGKPAPVVALAGDLAVVNPDSPYLDRLALLAVEAEVRLGRPDRAAAALASFLTDHPGSPLVPEARRRLESLRAAPSQPSKR